MQPVQQTHKVYQVNEVDVFKAESGYFLIQPQNGLVAVCCTSFSEINGVHCWAAHGAKSIYHFLADLKDKHYVIGKLFRREDVIELDVEATKHSIKNNIVHWRKSGDLDAMEARKLWDKVEQCEAEEDFLELGIDEVWHYFVKKDTYAVEWFWEHMWLPLVEMAKHKAEEIDKSC